MSYWVCLDCGEEVCEVNRHAEGAIFPRGGTDRAELNITGNYSRVYAEAGAIAPRQLDGRRAAATIEPLTRGVATLGVETDADYWKPTRGNAGFTLSVLLAWATAHPEGAWRVGE